MNGTTTSTPGNCPASVACVAIGVSMMEGGIVFAHRVTIDAGTRHEDRDGAELLTHGLHRGVDLTAIRDVDRPPRDPAVFCFQLADTLPQKFGLQIEHGHRITGLGQSPTDAQANARSRARDTSNALLELLSGRTSGVAHNHVVPSDRPLGAANVCTSAANRARDAHGSLAEKPICRRS